MRKPLKYSKNVTLALGLWVKLARASAVFSRLIAEKIRTYGLTEPQFAVIECLGHLGSMNLTGLSKKILASGANLTCIIDNLEKDGFVSRVPGRKDRRVIFVRLTPKGNKIFKETFVPVAEFIASGASVLSETEQKELSVLLRKFGLSLQERNSHGS